jgi:hypothetical protein
MRSDFINKRLINRRRQTPTSQPTLVDGEIILIPSFDTFIWHSSIPGNDRWSNALEVGDQSQAPFSPQLPIGLLNPWNDYNDQGSGGLLPPGSGPSTTLAVRTPTRIVMGFDLSGVPTAANITEATLMLTVSSSENWTDAAGSFRFAEQSQSQSEYTNSFEVYKDGMYYRIRPVSPPPETEEEKEARIARYLEVYSSGSPPEENTYTDGPSGSSGGFPPEIYDPATPGILWWDDETEVDGWSPEGWYLPCTRQQDNRKVHPNYPISPMVIPCDGEVPDIYNGRCPDYVIEDPTGFGELYRGTGSRWWYRDAKGRWWFLDDWIHDINNRNADSIFPTWIPYVPGLGVPIGGNGKLREWFENESVQPLVKPWLPELGTEDFFYFPSGILQVINNYWFNTNTTWKDDPKFWWKNFRYAPSGFVAKPDAYPCPPARTPPEIA